MRLIKLSIIFLIMILSQAMAEIELTVSAASSLKNVFTEIKDDFEKSHPGVKILLNFAASGQLQTQIEMGAPVDIFASASTKETMKLIESKLIDQQSMQYFASNQIVLIQNKTTEFRLKDLAGLNNPSVRKIAIGNTQTVPAGKYAAQTLKFYNLTDNLKDKLIPCENVRQVLDYVERNEVDAGFVFASDALIGKNIKVIATIPAEAHEKIIYPISILKTSQSQQLCRQFIQYVLQSRSILQKYGFGDL